MIVEPLAGALGAEIRGVSLATLQEEAAWQAIHRAFLQYSVIVFRDQALEPADLMRVGARFGEPCFYPFVTGLEGYPYIFEVVKEERETTNFGGNWHSDTAYLAQPPLATLLHALETPAHGGGRSRMHSKIGGMKVHDTDSAGQYEAEHPMARTHPETGRKALYVSRSHTIRFKNMSEEESRPLIEFLQAHQTRPEFTCRVRWSPGTLTVWDNRCTQHSAVNDYHGQRRRMRRLTVGAQAPR